MGRIIGLPAGRVRIVDDKIIDDRLASDHRPIVVKMGLLRE